MADNGNGMLTHPLVKLVLQVGVPSGIAVYLVYMLAGSIVAETRSTHELLRQHVEATASQQAMQRTIVDLLRQMCVNSAQSDEAKQTCQLIR